MAKKLYRSKEGKLLGGVCGGIAKYLDADPTIIRLLFVFILLFTGGLLGFVLYIIAWVVIPMEETEKEEKEVMEKKEGGDRLVWVLVAFLIVTAILLAFSSYSFFSYWSWDWFDWYLPFFPVFFPISILLLVLLIILIVMLRKDSL